MTAKAYFQAGAEAFHAGKMGLAEQNFRASIELDPQNPHAHLRLAYAISAPHRTSEALAETLEALRLDPHLTAGYGLLSSLYQRLGQFDRAIESCHRALAIEPDLIPPYATIVRCKRVEPSDGDLLARMEKLLAHPSRTTIERLILSYALGKAYDDLSQFESAIKHFDVANQLGQQAFHGKLRYDFNQEEGNTNRLIQQFTTGTFDRLRPLGSDSETPVFVVGMLRSGTTLLDSLLSRHADIASAGELYFWKREATRLGGIGTADALTRDELQKLASDFLESLANSAGPASKAREPRVIDKMPLNFKYLGMIYAAFPKARIIHIRRHPVDTCISLYTTQFANFPPEFGFIKANIVHAYREYQKLMSHWRKVLPADRFIETDYQQIVENKEIEIQKLFAFLGCSTEADMLSHQSPAEVFTPSLWQVRQPLYRNSLDRWKNYEPWLGEFASLLE
jgi:tetratricopeptide (TPR) repeat protein